MGDYINQNQQEFYWNNQGPDTMQQQNFYEQDYNQFTNQQLEFKSNEDFADQSFSQYPTGMYNPNDYDIQKELSDDLDEPPLLEELEIYPDRILEKVLAVLNPFRGHSLADDAEYLTKDSDLAGPIFFCLALAASLLLAGKTSSFSYIYGFSMVSCILMFFLLTLMTVTENMFTFTTVSSILGYCLIPVVMLSLLGVLFNLNGLIGIVIAVFCVVWASFSASRLFVAISSDKEQQPLIMYPSALIYGVFTLLVVF